MLTLPPFDELVKLDDEALDKLHTELFEDAIKHLPKDVQQRERAKQWRRKQELGRIKNKQVRAQVAHDQMMKSFNELNQQLQTHFGRRS